MLLGKQTYCHRKLVDCFGARRAIAAVIERRALRDDAISIDRTLYAARDCFAGARNDGWDWWCDLTGSCSRNV
jgi:hypothetical protein